MKRHSSRKQHSSKKHRSTRKRYSKRGGGRKTYKHGINWLTEFQFEKDLGPTQTPTKRNTPKRKTPKRKTPSKSNPEKELVYQGFGGKTTF